VTRNVLAFWDLLLPKEERFICHVVSDTTAVNPAMVRLLDGGGYEWIPCACHLLQLVVNDALKYVTPILQRHRNIVRPFSLSSSPLLSLPANVFRFGFSRNQGSKKPNLLLCNKMQG
jgi:hypothetical protein